MKHGIAALLILLSTGGCASNVGSASNCAGWRYLEYEESDLDTMSETLAAGLRAHNERWLKVCEDDRQ